MAVSLLELSAWSVAESPERLPWPVSWVHSPKTGSFFGAAVASLLCDGYDDSGELTTNATSEFRYRQWQGTKVRCRGEEKDCELTCSAAKYYGRQLQISLAPHARTSFADGHFPVRTGRGSDVMLFLRDPATRLASHFQQGMLRWCEGDVPAAAAAAVGTKKESLCFADSELAKLPKAQRKDFSCERFLRWTEIPGVKSCTTKLLLGRPCHATQLPSDEEALKARELIQRGRGLDNLRAVFVGDTNRWDLSICLFYARFGQRKCPPRETLSDPDGLQTTSGLRNKKDRPPYTCAGQNASLADDDTDGLLYDAAVDRVDREWRQFGPRVSHCDTCRRFLGLSAA